MNKRFVPHVFSAPRAAAALVAAAMASAPSLAGVKYWDNPAFKAYDVGDYVQDGLVLNYDGIRNAGPDAAHDPNATTWVNLGTGGSDYDMVRKGSPTDSCWSDNGFFFEGKTWFVATNKFSVPNAYEMESLISAEHAKQTAIGYVFFLSTAYPRASENDGWRWGSFGIRMAGTTYNQSIDGTQYNATLNLNTDGAGAGTVKRPVLLDESFGYLTAVANKTYASIFTGLQEPTGAPGLSGLASGKTELSGNSLYPYLGGHDDTGGETTCAEGIVGTIRNFRFYSAPLSYEQRAWNRVVDNARYFGTTSAALPVTNAVVTANYEYASGDTPNGTYAVDSEGYTFTAPATKGFQGRAFTLTGYTVERWDATGGTWGAAEQHAATADGASVTVSASDCVRITWLWDAPASARTYSLSDYVSDGLLLFYDGICNQGADKPHDSTATTWMNIGNGDGSQDCTLSLNRKRSTAGDAGAWGADGYNFMGYSEFKKEFSLSHPTTHSIQILLDADKNDQIYPIGYAYATAYDYSSFILSKNGTPPAANSLCWCAGGSNAPKRPYVQHSDGKYGYATAIMDGTARTQAFTEGTTIPSSGSLANGFYQSESDFPDFTAARIFLGGYNGGTGADNAYLLVGKVKFFRYYPNKKLTEAELAQNRKVDDYRYFGKLPPITTTNVIVQSTYSYLQGNEPDGAYETGSSHTFTAPATVTAANGITYASDGYTIETWDGSAWGAPVAHEGAAYAYTTSAGLVRLTWKWRATHGIRTASDYGVGDYLQDGLVVNYDGIRNAGPDAAHDPAATTWVNCANPGTYDMTRYSLVNSAWAAGSAAGSWTDDGFVFAKDAVFHESTPFVAPTQYSIQTLVDATAAAQKGIGYIMCGHNADNWGNCSVGIRSTAWNNIANTYYLVCEGPTGGRPSIHASSDTERFSYATAMLDKTNAVMFAGVTAPWTASTASGGALYGHVVSTSKQPASYTFANGYSIGGHYPKTDELFSGTIKNYRFYDRVLSDAEVAHNRQVDSARFFGALATTNVVVAVEDGAGITAAETAGEAYFVEGEYTFTAAGSAGLGYRLSVPDGNGGWRTIQSFTDGGSYTYDKTAAGTPALVKLEWRVQKPFMMVVR